MGDEIDRLKHELTDRLEDVILYFNGPYEERNGVAYPAARSPKELGSFQVNLRPKGKYPRGFWYRFSQGIGGDVIHLIAYLLTDNHADVREGIRAGKAFLGWTDERASRVDPALARQREEDRARRRAEQREEAELDEAQKMARAEKIWKEIKPIEGTHAEAYLLARGIPQQKWPSCLGFHPSLAYSREHGRFPCLVARRDNPDESFGGIWRIYLDPVSPRKADVPTAKLGLGSSPEAAVQLGPPAERIAICEGIETGFGALAIGIDDPPRPVWACLSTSGLQTVRFPVDVDDVLILADGDWPKLNEKTRRVTDPPGRVAAEKARGIHESFGLKVSISEPPHGMDWLDVWNAVGSLVGAES